MGEWFWILFAIGASAVLLMGIVNVGAFVLSYRAGLSPPRTQLLRGVLVLAVALVFPRILPSPLLWTGALMALFLWEVGVWVCRARTRQTRIVPLTTINHP